MPTEWERIRAFFVGQGRWLNIGLLGLVVLPWLAVPMLIIVAIASGRAEAPVPRRPGPAPGYSHLLELARQGDPEEFNRSLQRRAHVLRPAERRYAEDLASFSRRFTWLEQQRRVEAATGDIRERARVIASLEGQGQGLAARRHEDPKVEVDYQHTLAELLYLDPANAWALSQKGELGSRK